MSFVFLLASLVALIGNTIAAGDSCDGKSSRCAVQSADAALEDVQFKLLKVPICGAAANRTEFQMTSFDDCKAKAIEKSAQGFRWIEEDTICSVFDLNLDFVCEGNQVGDDVHVAWPPVDKGINSNDCSQAPVSFLDFSYLSSLSSELQSAILVEESTGGAIEDCAQSGGYDIKMYDSSKRCFGSQSIFDFESCAVDCGESQRYFLLTYFPRKSNSQENVNLVSLCGETHNLAAPAPGSISWVDLFSHEGFGCRPVPDLLSEEAEECSVLIRAENAVMLFVFRAIDISPGQNCTGESLSVTTSDGMFFGDSCNMDNIENLMQPIQSDEINLKYKRVRGAPKGMGFGATLFVVV